MRLIKSMQTLSSHQLHNTIKSDYIHFANIALTVFSLQFGTRTSADGVTLSMKDAPLENVFREISRQTMYDFVYRWEILENKKNINLHCYKESIVNVLEKCLENRRIKYKIIDRTIVLVAITK